MALEITGTDGWGTTYYSNNTKLFAPEHAGKFVFVGDVYVEELLKTVATFLSDTIKPGLPREEEITVVVHTDGEYYVAELFISGYTKEGVKNNATHKT